MLTHYTTKQQTSAEVTNQDLWCFGKVVQEFWGDIRACYVVCSLIAKSLAC